MNTSVAKTMCISFVAGLMSLTMFAFFSGNDAPAPSGRDKDGHSLVSLWAGYDKAASADRPVRQEEILSEIIREASVRHLPWDFYDASEKYVSVASSRNWKLADSLKAQFRRDVESFGEPIVSFVWMLRHSGRPEHEIFDYILSNAGTLKKGCSKAFYSLRSGHGGIYGVLSADFLKEFYADDYEYALWQLLPFTSKGNVDEGGIYEELKKYESGSYPLGAYLEYLPLKMMAEDSPESRQVKKAALETFVRRFDGKAVSMYAGADLLGLRFSQMNRESASGEAFRAFYGECKAFEAARNALKGPEAVIAKGIGTVSVLMEVMTAKSLAVSVEDGKIVILMKNVGQADVTMYPVGKPSDKILDVKADNAEKSFCKTDTVTVPLPDTDDGEYVIDAVSGKVSGGSTYVSYRISLAHRADSRGICLYAAGYKTGEPVGKADLFLKKNGKIIARHPGFEFDGFTPVPDDIAARIKGDSYYGIFCSFAGEDGLLRRSRDLDVTAPSREISVAKSADELELTGELFTDRGACNPGDTLQFKAVLLRTDYVGKAETVEEGVPVRAVLTDPEDKEAGSVSLKTNGFGSVAGSFVIPRGGRGGYYTLSVSGTSDDGEEIVSRFVRVDEFVLPSFEVVFDRTDELYLPGDTVTVTGRVSSYSGHPVSSGKAEYTVTSYGRVISSGKLGTADGGAFSINFRPDGDDGWRIYGVSVKITDLSGETCEYSKTLWVTGHPDLSVNLKNSSDGRVGGLEVDGGDVVTPVLLRCDRASVLMQVLTPDGIAAPADIRYALSGDDGRVIVSGTAASGTEENIDLSLCPSGLYELKADVSVRSDSGREYADTASLWIVLLRDTDTVLNAPVEGLVAPCGQEVPCGGDAAVVFGSAAGTPVWAVAEVFGPGSELLESRFVHLDGVSGADGSLEKLSFEYKEDYPEEIRVQLFYFKDCSPVFYSCGFHRAEKAETLPLEFVSFEDKTLPASSCSFSVKTLPGAEVLVAVFDKSSETVARNDWPVFSLAESRMRAVPVISVCGRVGGGRYGGRVLGYGSAKRLTRSAASYADNMADNMMAEGISVLSAVPEDMTSGGAPGGASDGLPEVPVREKFSGTLAFLPFLRADGDGLVPFRVNTSDKLSTYCVAVYAHDTDMRNAAVRREMMVTIPVKVSILEPGYLYENDIYTLSAQVSSTADAPVSGTMTLSVYRGDSRSGSPVAEKSVEMTIPAGGAANALFDVDVKALAPDCAGDTLGLRAVFRSGGDDLSGADPAAADAPGSALKSFSDGVFVTVPVLAAEQSLVEAHSAVLLSGEDRETLIGELRSRFVNVSGDAAECKVSGIMDMIRDAIPSRVDPEGRDVLSLSEAVYVRLLAERLAVLSRKETPAGRLSDAELMHGVMSCRNADGGFGWFEGMRSSPVMTAVLLERFRKMLDAGLLDWSDAAGDGDDVLGDVLSSAVKYLDGTMFGEEEMRPYLCGGLSREQYMYVRSMFCDVPFDEGGVKSSSSAAAAALGEFRKNAEEYLVPRRSRGLEGLIIAKARRAVILDNLLSSDGGTALAKAWGLGAASRRRMSSSLEADMASLLEYAVPHKDGGMYYPNAVMPFRGLLESEAYAHSMLCDLLTRYAAGHCGGPRTETPSDAAAAGKVADGIRIWLMIQKESQHWDESPAFVDAINSVMAGSGAVKETAVISLSAGYTAPFDDIKASGNGFTIERRFFREVPAGAVDASSGDSGKPARVEILQGDRLEVGDKIIAEYRIHSDENRSFVRITAPREAALRPVSQLSGVCGTGLRPVRVSGWYSVVSQGYRNVGKSATEYYFDSYPEEDTVMEEEMFVVRAGRFAAPAVTVESMYAPHYRANGSPGVMMVTKRPTAF